ncbi:DNA polymerase ligase N-terminal domain-containing protein [Saccharomonospora saliphila]|uniref:DNA polymerase ligase N-terminal domain-containing protein n=1 Tax=Saccharomonospora saliphila TaxID=369829 RepID=UPI000362CB4D|nr:DNA polymerase ligase N-terminal domain-containing protein [Saccharomonospora saliphila]
MIERYDVSSLHYDFRLEIGGVLVSWAIPSEPSLEPGDKRLAIRTDDVATAPANRGGPDGGATTVLVWDSGTFDNLADEPVEHGLVGGRLRLWIVGHRLRGAFEMVRTRESPTQEQWLLIKRDDREAGEGASPGLRDPALGTLGTGPGDEAG